MLAAIAEPALAARVTQILETQYVVETVQNGRVALARIRDFAPDIVVSDAEMPELDGFGLLHELRSDAATQAIPLILLSARSSGEFAIEGLEAVADDYLEKPFPVRELLARVRTHLEFARSRRAWGAEIARAQTELERLRVAYEVFHDAVARDLRVPLRAIDGFSSAVLERCGGTLDARSNLHLERIRAGAKRMGTIIDDLLTLSRVAEVTMHLEPVRLTDIARRTIDELRQQSPERDFVFEAQDDVLATADKNLAGAVVRILVANAWKFTQNQARTEIAFGITRHASKLSYFVRDNGVGFDEAYADKLFSPFQRMHRDDEFPGNGIGLAIAKQAVGRHGGEIWATGVVNGGATFHFTLGPDWPKETAP